MYQVIWSREVEGEDFPVHEVVFEASSWQQCYQKLVDNAKATFILLAGTQSKRRRNGYDRIYSKGL